VCLQYTKILLKLCGKEQLEDANHAQGNSF
jgi:hypothetical protein